MKSKQFKIVGLGEVLFDVLPSGEKMPGGAPANFAFISTRLGDRGIVASAVGSDSDGGEILQSLQQKGIDVSHIQIDAEHPTGTVKVSLENGQPGYQITENTAWDFLELTDDWRDLAKNCDAVCFGSLAQRNAVSRETVLQFLALTDPFAKRIFDVNLRQNYYSSKILEKSLNLATIAKFNHEELPIIAEMLKIKGENDIQLSLNFCKKFDLELICVTRGSNGSLLASVNEISESAGIKIEIADTIGAGDAFTAALTHGVLRGWSLDDINQKANQTAALVASQIGAMPQITI